MCVCMCFGVYMASSVSTWSSPCAACKFLRRKCTAECVFAPYFPPEQPQKFASVHKVFGAGNVTKLLNELPFHQREDAVNSLAYEAEARVKDPVYGCVGAISVLQRHVTLLQKELNLTRSQLARYASEAAAASSSSSSTLHHLLLQQSHDYNTTTNRSYIDPPSSLSNSLYPRQLPPNDVNNPHNIGLFPSPP